MATAMISLAGRVARGHRVASGLGGDTRFPAGTIAPQLPFFKSAIPGFESWLEGEACAATINVALTALTVSPGAPDVIVGPIQWTSHFAPERFLLTRCWLKRVTVNHRAWLYIPDPATKPDHFQPDNLIEILAQRIRGLSYDDAVEVLVPSSALTVSRDPVARPDLQS